MTDRNHDGDGDGDGEGDRDGAVDGDAQLVLHRGDDGRLVLQKTGADGQTVDVRVQVALCFPWSCPDRFVSLRNDQGEEERLIADHRVLPPASRALVEQELRLRYFVARIVRVDEIADEADLFRWRVVTDAGPRTFLTSRTERPRRLKTGAFVVRDVSHDVYLIERVDALDTRSRARLALYLD